MANGEPANHSWYTNRKRFLLFLKRQKFNNKRVPKKETRERRSGKVAAMLKRDIDEGPGRQQRTSSPLTHGQNQVN